MLRRITSFGRGILKSGYFWLASRRLVRLFKRGNYTRVIKLKYKDLNYLRYTDIDTFKMVKRGIEDYNVKLAKTREKIRVSFIIYSAAMWPCEELLKMMEQDDAFEVGVVVAEMKDGTAADRARMYEATKDFFKENGHRAFGAKDESTLEIIRSSQIIF